MKRIKYNFKNNKRAVKTVVGTLKGNARGFAFLCGEGYEDIYIPPDSLKGAIHGDVVEAKVYSDHGEVTRIIKSETNEIIGVYVEELNRGKVIADGNCYKDVFIIGGKAKTGDRVVVRLSRKDKSKGEIVAVLGRVGTLEADVAAVVHTLHIDEFSAKAIGEADSEAGQKVSLEGRADFTLQPCFTIDGEDSKDFDDAVYAENSENGFKLWVHIADVAHYVRLGGSADNEAFKRGNSFYYGDNVIPMLPESLSNGACSLNEGELRYTVSAIMDISANGEITGGEIKEGVVCSHKRMTYDKADKALKGETKEYDEFIDTLKILLRLRNALKKKRDEEGNIDFDLSEPKFEFEGGKVVCAERAPKLITHSIIEECMIAANRFVAKKFLSLKLPFVFRVHKQPLPESMEKLNVFLSAIGEKEIGYTSKDIADLLRRTNKRKRQAVSSFALRCMTKAEYSIDCGGHYGLAIKEYCHFTSPIRRYSDLTIHRVIKAYLHGEDCDHFKNAVEEAARQASIRERVSEKAERKIDDLYMAEYMSRFIGEKFEGIISGVTEWGIFVRLENTAEGLIRAEELGETIFYEETLSMSVKGKGVFRLGDKIEVILESATSGNIVFELA